MALLVVFNNPDNPNRWRPHERELLVSRFGDIREVSAGHALKAFGSPDAALWRLSAEKTSAVQFNWALEAESKWWGVPQINRPSGWLAAHAKDYAFLEWGKHRVPHPEWGYVRTIDDLARVQKRLPALVRINYANTGDGTLLCKSTEDLLKAWASIPAWYVSAHARYGPGVARATIWTKFIDAPWEGLRYSYRIIVCCGKIVTGYARTCPADSWLAITSKFRPEDGEKWLELNRRCRTFCRDNEAEIVRSVRCLGLEWQGVDVIFDAAGNPYFLEVQPDYSCGNPRYGDQSPWYNPSYPELVKFLKDNIKTVDHDLPEYSQLWLNKREHFRACADMASRYAGVR